MLQITARSRHPSAVSMNVGVPPVVLKSARKHTATLIFLHGLGDTGMGWAGALNTIRPDYLKVKIIFRLCGTLR